MLTAFARFGERTATIARMPGTEGVRRVGWQGGRLTTCMVQAPWSLAPAFYLLAAILLISSSTRQLSCSFS